jgi:hypothetical protein
MGMPIVVLRDLCALSGNVVPLLLFVIPTKSEIHVLQVQAQE